MILPVDRSSPSYNDDLSLEYEVLFHGFIVLMTQSRAKIQTVKTGQVVCSDSPSSRGAPLLSMSADGRGIFRSELPQVPSTASTTANKHLSNIFCYATMESAHATPNQILHSTGKLAILTTSLCLPVPPPMGILKRVL